MVHKSELIKDLILNQTGKRVIIQGSCFIAETKQCFGKGFVPKSYERMFGTIPKRVWKVFIRLEKWKTFFDKQIGYSGARIIWHLE